MKEKKQKSGRLVMGKNCLQELLEHSPNRIIRTYVAQHMKKLKGRHASILQKLQEKKIPIQFVDKKELSNLVQSESHQSFVALVKDRKDVDLKSFLNKDKCFVLMLDSINDPQNLGAILRSAECFGVDLIVWSKNRGCDITPTVSKASVGASELINISRVSNLAETIRLFQKNDFEVFVADSDSKAKDLSSISFPEKMILVVGSEGSGVQPLIKKLVDQKVYIPMHGKINSLNVAQATSVLLSFWGLFYTQN